MATDKGDSEWPEWMKKGVRVVRGPDWSATIRNANNADLGTLSYVSKNPRSGNDRVSVVWDTGLERSYSSGLNGQYVLRAYDIQQVGIVHAQTQCDHCKMKPLRGSRYNCPKCDFNLCTKCYMADVHDLTHNFIRIDTPNSRPVNLPKRRKSPKLQLMGVFVDAEVIRGPHWNYPNKDGGDLNKGKVKALIEDKDGVSNGWVRVKWEIGNQVEEYRFGAGGYVDVVAVKAIHGGDVYIEHIPLVGKKNLLKSSDKVEVHMDLQMFKKVQEEGQVANGWKDAMKQCLEEVGTVLELLYDGKQCRVQYENGEEFIIVIAALYRTAGFYVDCVVQIVSKLENLKKLQDGHGGFSPNFAKIVGKFGKVVKILKDGDLTVQIGCAKYTLNPTACMPVEKSKFDAAMAEAREDSEEEDEDMDDGLDGDCVGGREDESDGDCVPGRGCLAEDLQAQALSEKKEFKEFAENMREFQTSLMKVDLQDLTNLGNTMFDAFTQADLPKVKKMVEEHKLLVNHKVESRTLLHLAAHEGYSDLVSFLLEMDADLTEKDEEGDTPLHYAAFGKQSDCVKILLLNGADVNAQNNTSLTPLVIAINHPDVETVQCLLANNADVNLKNAEGDTALHDALEQEDNQPQLTEVVLSTKMADFTISNSKDFNVLQWAVIKNNRAGVKIILDKTAGIVNIPYKDGFTNLHIASANDFVELCSILLEGNADPNAPDDMKRTPLHLAVAQAHKRVIEVLIDNKADVNAQDSDGDTPLHLAQNQKKQMSMTMSKSRRTKPNSNIQIVYFLLEKGADITIKNKLGETPIDLIKDIKMKTMIKGLTDSYKSQQPSPSGVRLPIHWRASKNVTEVDIIALDTKDSVQKQEYDEVVKHFCATLPHADIQSVKRVQNPLLWEHFTLKKREMEKKLGQGCANEQHMYHGTNSDLVDIIAEQNFDFRIAGSRVGALYGDGSYFATTSKYSDLYASPNGDGVKVMFVAKVLVGKITLGKPGLKRPPLLDESDKKKGIYDSVVNNVLNPTIYCVFDVNQYYPEYLIEYL